MRFSLLSLLIFLAVNTSADTLTGKVVKVADGDTVTVLAEGNQQVRVRLAVLMRLNVSRCMARSPRRSCLAVWPANGSL